MDVFELREMLTGAYRDYATSFMRIRDDRIRCRVDEALDAGKLWPHPLIGLNPAFKEGGTIDDLVSEGVLHPTTADIFRLDKSETDRRGKPLDLYRHQADAIRTAARDRNYVLTTGTGSGKSLAYIIPIVDHVLRAGTGKGVKAIVVYPMNALANSQREELRKFLDYGPWVDPPVTFARYTGQDDAETRQDIQRHPPDILLTNYVMLELILTRHADRNLVRKFGSLRYLVLDELHTYRGRQGADVAMLVRRVRQASGAARLRCVGTSATLSTEGTHAERQGELAKVSSRLFGDKVGPDDVIGETLRRVTPAHDLEDRGFQETLRAAVAGARPPDTYEGFREDPLAAWIETTFGLDEVDGSLVRADPLAIEGPDGGAERLARITGLDQQRCSRAIRDRLVAGNEIRHAETGRPAFGFRLHQFISRGDTVFASPELPARRHITLHGQRFVPGDRERVLLPLAFCRACGQDYYIVCGGTPPGNEFEPRDLGDTQDQDPGFLYLSEDRPWPEDDSDQLDRLPESWLEPGSRRVRANRRPFRPRRLVVGPDGAVLADDDGGRGTVGWWIPTPFRFCLNCGMSYEGRLGRDFARLTTLGSDGRSTATTIMSLATVRYLREDSRLPAEARKLLSFTDNRQDASLQAGHFNDFVQITLLRAALWRALDQAGPSGLTHDQVPRRVFEALDMPFDAYALDPDLRGPARNDTDGVFRDVLAYRLYRDLRRGWRLTQPNLEQTGLLTIEYEALSDLASDESVWSDAHSTLVACPPEQRATVLEVLLDWMRRELALRVGVLDQRQQETLVRRADQRLTGPWSLEDERGPWGARLEYATEALARPARRSDIRSWSYVSARGGFGQYLRRPDGLGRLSTTKLTLADTTIIISQLFDGLRRYGLVVKVGEDRDGNPRWQVPAAALRWKAGDGVRPYVDRIRMPNPPDEMPTNRYFVELYRQVGASLVGIEAREHTAQVSNEERMEREKRFRSAELPVMFCSPTMELGVDISELNVVNLRNVPPTPANYAQRSGRAGRGGQAALVFAYCSTGSSHDQHFFRRPEQMVAGQVEAPRIDITNEDLIRAHVHAVWLAVSGLNLGRSMGEVLDLSGDADDPPLARQVEDHLHNPASRVKAGARARQVLANLSPDLQAAPWWSDRWLDDVLNAVPLRFEDALKRWKSLYAAAVRQQREQNAIALSATRSARDRRQARDLRAEAERQLDILRATNEMGFQSDFYPYRYFAAEGFLPGYSFPRLPLSAFIPGRRGRRDQPEYLHRPRFLAISEFGPQTFIYHEGARYRINRVILSPDPDAVPSQDSDDDALVTARVKRCGECGYMHRIHTPPGPDVCEYCRTPLGAEWSNLLRMQNVSTVRRDRITSDEEERRRVGFEVISGVQFARRRGRRMFQRAEVTTQAERPTTVLRLTYGDTATVWRVNLGWRRRRNLEQRGFILDVERGYWGKRQDQVDDDPMSNRTRRVVPFVTDSRNALLIEPDPPLSIDQMASLEAALKAAIETVFHLESNELATEPLPSRDDRRLLLFYESAEGGAGVLKQLVEDPGEWRRVARQALLRCHFDPDTGEKTPVPGVEPCEAACYDCLLTYRNQLDHRHLDRAAIKEVLEDLMTARLRSFRDAPYQVESSLEADFLAHLDAGGYRRPDRDQVYFESAGTRPDFLYDEACVAVYVDGPHHDYPERRARDRESAAAMRDLGYLVIRFGYRDDWDQIICEHPSVFGAGHTRESVS